MIARAVLPVARPTMFAPAFPTIRPESLCRLGNSSFKDHHPFSAPFPADFYFARNAIWQAVRTLGLAPGEVVVPAYHHGVEIEALVDAGLSPRFYSVDSKMGIDLEEIESLIGPRTSALYLTHFLGFPGPVREMKALAVRRGLLLIEDCALALFSKDAGLPLGVTGDAAIFCLYKVLGVPDGGVLVYPGSSRRAESPRPPPPLVSGLAVLSSSILRNIALRGASPGRRFRQAVLALGKRALKATSVEPVLVGTQHFNRAHAGLGPSRWTRHLLKVQDVPAIIAVRRRNYLYLLDQLRAVSPPLFDDLPPGVAPLCYPMLVDDNRWFMEQLVARGIEAVDFWREGHPACDVSRFPAVGRLRSSVLEIPCHQDLTPDILRRMAAQIRDLVQLRSRAT